MKLNLYIRKYSDPCMWAAGILSLLGLLFQRLPVPGWTADLMFICAMILAGVPILIRAVQGLRYKSVGIECLVSIAVIGACVIREFSEAAIVTFLFQFGSYLEQRTMKKTRSAIKQLTEMVPATAWKLTDDIVEEIDADEVEEDDLLLVKTGSQIAVDGIVTEGEGYVNEASITGESTLVRKEKGSTVYAGSLLDSGTLTMRATKVGEDTTFAKIIALVEEAQDAKSPAERFIDRFARYYTPAVVLIAVLTFLFSRNLDTAITVLVLACPGALVIGAPIANVAGIGRGAQEGILLKGGDSVHTFVKTDTVVFDKTGTLTVGQPSVICAHFFAPQNVKETDGERLSERAVTKEETEQILSMVASAEMASEHPLAQAIVGYVTDQGLPVSQVVHADVEKGYGIRADIDGKELMIGSQSFMEKYSIHPARCVSEQVDEVHASGATAVLVALDGEVAAVLGIADAVKPDAADSLKRLQKQGIRHLVMLSGDHESTAKAVAGQIGITEYHGGLLPADKVAYIQKMQKNGQTVTFVGDGINDSPALATADTGIAMGSGTDVAIDSSDVVLIRSDLKSLASGYALAKRIVRIMYQNIAIAVGTVILLLAGLFAGYIHMAIGMLIHEASILVVIFNAMRLMIRREKMTKKTIQMEELVCPMCAQKIETALKKAKGVENVKVLYNASKAKVEFDETQTDVEALKKVITDLGYVVIK